MTRIVIGGRCDLCDAWETQSEHARRAYLALEKLAKDVVEDSESRLGEERYVAPSWRTVEALRLALVAWTYRPPSGAPPPTAVKGG